MGYEKEQSSMIVCGVNTIIGAIFVFDGGFYVFMLFDENVTLFSCFLIVGLEALIAGHYIGKDKLQKLSVEATDKSIPEYFITAYKYYCPIVFSTFIIISIYKWFFNNEEYKVFWPQIVKFIIIVSPIVAIVYFYLKHRNDSEDDKENELIDLNDNKNNNDSVVNFSSNKMIVD